MKKTIYAIMAILTLAGCGKPTQEETQEPEPITISMEESEITIHCGESKQVNIIGTSEYCSVKESDEFVVWASGGNNRIEIEGQHVGEATVTVSCDAAENEASCKVRVIPSIDYIGPVAPLFGKTKSEVKAAIDPSYEKAYTDSQRRCVTYNYKVSGYSVANRYYYVDDKLYGIHKSIESPNDSESQAFINIALSLDEYMEILKAGSQTSGRAYSHPSGYYAVLHSPTLNDKHDIFYAEDLEVARSHSFIKFH